MQIKTQEHADVMVQFEQEFKGLRFDREAKDMWPRGAIYQDGPTNELFLSYRRGYALARSVYMPASTTPDGWQLITSAPKDGTRLLVWDQSWCGGKARAEVSYWQPYKTKSGDGPFVQRGSWMGISIATHWMPLPAPPAPPEAP